MFAGIGSRRQWFRLEDRRRDVRPLIRHQTVVLGTGHVDGFGDASELPVSSSSGRWSSWPPHRVTNLNPPRINPNPAAPASLANESFSGRALDPGLFAEGSCVAFAPTSGDRHQTVFLGAGHGGLNPGAVGLTTSGQPIYEADQTLPVELDTMGLLRAG